MASPPPRLSPERPATCHVVVPGESLQAVVDAAPDRTALCLSPGTYDAPVALARGVVLWGPRDAVVRSRGQGTTVTLGGTGTQLLGVTVDGSGDRFDTTDAGVLVLGAQDARVEGVRLVNATFGILVERSRGVIVRANEVVGNPRTSLGMRGDGIRLWETRDSIVDGNVVRSSRDVVVWFSPNNRVENNDVENSRYGTHLMYSSDAVVANNRYVRDEVGVFVMYSRNVDVDHNIAADAGGSAGMGIGLKESGNVRVRNNLLVHDSVGVYIDESPLQPQDFDAFDRNVFRLDDTAVVFHASPRGTSFRQCSFRDNSVQVRVDGGGDATGITWDENDWSDYAGYDLNGDGIGDAPYELRSLSLDLIDAHPDLAFFAGAPTLALVEAAGRALPVFEPRTVLRDAHPRMSPLPIGGSDAH